MPTFARELALQLSRAARSFAAIVVTGPRRAGKTHLLRTLFPRASYQLLESPDVIARVRDDPRGWLESLKPPVTLDEIQNAPELFPVGAQLHRRAAAEDGPLADHWLAGLLADGRCDRVDGGTRRHLPPPPALVS